MTRMRWGDSTAAQRLVKSRWAINNRQTGQKRRHRRHRFVCPESKPPTVAPTKSSSRTIRIRRQRSRPFRHRHPHPSLFPNRLQLCPRGETLQFQIPRPSRSSFHSVVVYTYRRASIAVLLKPISPVASPGQSLREVQDDSPLPAHGEAVDQNIRRVSRNICTRENKHYG